MVPSPGVSSAPGPGVVTGSGQARPTGMRRTTRFSWRQASSPTKLRAAMGVTIVLALVLSVGGWFSVQRRATAIDDAAASAQQLIRVQDVRVQVVEADSLASRAYLSGGQEDPAERVAYDDALAAASRGLVDAATRATDEDAVLLEAASTSLARYVGLVEQARANNRQGFPVGAAYQRQARTVSESLVAQLREVESHARERVDDTIERAHRSSWLLVLTAMLVLVAIVLGGLWLAVRWKRLINVPLAVAGAVALLVLTAGGATNVSAMNDADEVVTGPLAAADLVAQARAAAFDARSNEALTLVYRGSGAAFAAQWDSSSSIVAAALAASCTDYGRGCDASEQYIRYTAGYTSVRELDDDGDWDAAVALSTTGSATSDRDVDIVDPVTPFEEFASATEDLIEQQSAMAATGLDDATSSLGTLSVLIVAAGVVIAVAAAAGYGQRLREYR